MRPINYITTAADAWYNEIKAILKDEGVLLFFVFLPIAYPILYSWIYNNEVAREVPVILVDDSHSTLSRDFAKMFDASPEVSIALQCNSIKEAKEAIGRSEGYGIIYFPEDFDKKVGRMEQSHVSVYCDMSYMLTYKAILVTANLVSIELGTKIQEQRLGNTTARQDEVSTHPLEFEEVPIFNVTGGYGNFILPAVLVLIIQQAMILGVGMIAGTERERKYVNYKARNCHSITQAINLLFGKSLCYLMIFSVMLAWITLAVPRFFGFVSMVHGWDLLQFFTPYLLSCVFFSIIISEMVRYRESVMLVVVFTSVPLLFMTGVSWPQTAIPGVWQGLSSIFPSTFAVRGFIRISSMGALLSDVAEEYRILWTQTSIYVLLALFVMWRRVQFTNEQTSQSE
ncbi:MAG: ABC transporter permease [Prevotella sp.]|nr:ABC transporter permease [Candidatus Prevotella equi]